MLIPFKTCNKAADTLISWFDSPEELRRIVGGERWWQVRGLDGLEAEWVTEKSLLKSEECQKAMDEKKKGKGGKFSDTELELLAMDGLEKVMVCLFESFRLFHGLTFLAQLYIHGGELPIRPCFMSG